MIKHHAVLGGHLLAPLGGLRFIFICGYLPHLLQLVALSLGSTASAQGFGVVLASFSKPENADRYRAQIELDIPEENLELTVLPSQYSFQTLAYSDQAFLVARHTTPTK